MAFDWNVFLFLTELPDISFFPSEYFFSGLLYAVFSDTPRAFGYF